MEVVSNVVRECLTLSSPEGGHLDKLLLVQPLFSADSRVSGQEDTEKLIGLTPKCFISAQLNQTSGQRGFAFWDLGT